VEAAVRVDGGGVFHPAISLFGASTEGVGTPAVDSSVVDDVYLTLASSPTGGKGPVTIDVVIQPLVLWLWVGGGTMAIGAVLAAVPGRRRRREDSELSASGSDRLDAGGAGDADGGGGAGGAEEDEATPAHSPDQAEVFA
jgi:cytochrome c-type biogenesis protein CcmF